MYKTIGALLVLVSLNVFADNSPVIGAVGQSTSEEELIALENEWIAAEVAGDKIC